MRYRSFFLATALLFMAASVALAADDWKPQRYPKDRFAAEFPSEPVLSDQKVDAAKMLRHTQYWSDAGDAAYGVSAVLFQHNIIAADTSDAHLRRVVEGVGGSLQCGVRGQRELSIPGGTAIEVIFENCQKISGGVAKQRIYLAGDWLYQVMVLGFRPGLKGAADTNRFLDSFSVTEQ